MTTLGTVVTGEKGQRPQGRALKESKPHSFSSFKKIFPLKQIRPSSHLMEPVCKSVNGKGKEQRPCFLQLVEILALST